MKSKSAAEFLGSLTVAVNNGQQSAIEKNSLTTSDIAGLRRYSSVAFHEVKYPLCVLNVKSSVTPPVVIFPC